MKVKNREHFHGRQGGRFAEENAGTDRVAEIHKIRLTAVAAGEWPEHSLVSWRVIAAGDPGDPLHAKAVEVVAAIPRDLA